LRRLASKMPEKDPAQALAKAILEVIDGQVYR
jgi:hypothetical protein